MRANVAEWEIKVPNRPVLGVSPISLREFAATEVMQPTTSTFPDSLVRKQFSAAVLSAPSR